MQGRVLRHDGKPAANSMLTLYGEPLRSITNGRDSINVQTSANGWFQLPNVPPGDYRLGMSGLGKSQPRFVVRAGQATVVNLELVKPRPAPRHMAKPYGAPPARRRIV